MSANQDVFQIGGSHNRLANLTIYSAQRYAVHVGDWAGTGTGNDNTITGLQIYDSGDAAIYVRGGGGGGGVGNVIAGNSLGVRHLAVDSCPTGDDNQYGVYMTSGASDTAVDDNEIGCSRSDGVYVDGVGDVHIRNNSIGFYWPGSGQTYARANANAGVSVVNGAHDVEIARNKIAGNDWDGIYVGSSSFVTLTANSIGLDVANGLSACANGWAGIAVINSHDVTVGAASSTAVDQFVSGNSQEGIYLSGATDVLIGRSTAIGVATDGTTPVGNGRQGIMLTGNTTRAHVYPDIVRYNGWAGVAVVAPAAGNQVEPRYVANNGGLAIDLANDGFTPNDAGDVDAGANNLFNYPVITGNRGTVVSGTATPFSRLQIYSAIGDPTAAGGGGERIAGVFVDATGNWSLDLASYGVTYRDLTLTACASACNADSDSSEFSPKTVNTCTDGRSQRGHDCGGHCARRGGAGRTRQ